MNKYFKEILFQIIPVAIGVYLGFFVSNWAEQRKSTNAAKGYIENLKSEINLNQNKIQGVAEYHKMLRDSSSHFALNAKDNDKPNFFQGTRTPPLLKSAFETGLQTGVLSQLTLEQIQSLNELYNQQQFYNDFGKTITNGLISFDFSNTESANLKKIASYLAITMTDVIFQEETLKLEFEKVLEILR